MRRRWLGKKLAEFRKHAELSQERVVALLGGTWDEARFSRVENGKRTISVDDVERLIGIYGIEDAEVVQMLLALARDAHKLGNWWNLYGDAVLPSSYQEYLWVETDAHELRANAPKIIPGLLQTPDYARVVIAATAVDSTQEDIDARAQIRKARQAVLAYRPDRPPLRLWAIIHESALRVTSASHPNLMRDQIDHLLEMADRPSITIQILPDTAESNPGMVNGFEIARFPGLLPNVVNVEHFSGGVIMEGERDVTMYETAFDLTVAAALPATESKVRLQQIKNGSR